MIEKNLSTTDGRIRVRMPSSLSEISLGQMIAMQEKKNLDDLDAISILTGVPKADLANVTSFNELGTFGEHILLLSEQIEKLYTNEAIPPKVTFKIDSGEVTIDVIHNLSVEPAGAFLAAREIIAEEIKTFIGLYGDENWKDHFQPSLKGSCSVLAQYFFCRVTKRRYDEYEAEAFGEEIKKLGVLEALPVARHFFTCYPNLSKPKTSFLHRCRRLWKKRRGFTLSKSLNISTPSTPSPAAT